MIETLLIATHNPGKLKEFQHLLQDYPVKVTSAGELNLPAPEEIGTTFLDNARIKAHAAAGISGLPTLADDSGITIKALGGPGVDTAAWMKAGNLNYYRDFENSPAFCTCILVFTMPDDTEQIFEGIVHGKIVSPRGTGGFGFDAHFQPDGETKTYAEMDTKALTHRTIAFQKFIAATFSNA